MSELPKRCETHAAEMAAAGHASVAETLRLAAARIRDLEHGMDAARIVLLDLGNLLGFPPETLRSADKGET